MLEKILKQANLFDVFIIFVASVAIVGFWRGVWNLVDKFLFPGNFVLSQLISIVGGILLLIILSRDR
jgi:hypothetical protein